MKIERLPSGSYRVRKMYQGMTYTVVFPEKPTQKEIMKAISAEMDKAKAPKTRMTFQTAAERYNASRSNVLSPATIRGYEKILRNISQKFRGMIVTDITSIDVQNEINSYSIGRSPKTVRNTHGYISAVLHMYCPNLILNTALPQKKKVSDYIPTDSDIKQLLSAAQGTQFYIPLILATYGLRRSEICALSINDLQGNVLTIDKAVVQNSDGEWVVKSTKTTDGTRTIYIPDRIAELIRKQGYIYKGYPNSIVCWMSRTEDKLGLQHFSLHKLRHYYASASHALGIPDSYIMMSGGWKSDNVLKSVYRHALDDKKVEMQRFAAEYIADSVLK